MKKITVDLNSPYGQQITQQLFDELNQGECLNCHQKAHSMVRAALRQTARRKRQRAIVQVPCSVPGCTDHHTHI